MCEGRLHADATTGIRRELRCLATFSLHSFGRYFQRACQATEEKLLDAIWSALPVVCDMLHTGELEEVSLPSAVGAWHGKIAHTTIGGDNDNMAPCFIGRTFFELG